VKSIKFLGVTMADDLSWSFHAEAVVKKAQQQRLFFLRRLGKFGMSVVEPHYKNSRETEELGTRL